MTSTNCIPCNLHFYMLLVSLLILRCESEDDTSEPGQNEDAGTMTDGSSGDIKPEACGSGFWLTDLNELSPTFEKKRCLGQAKGKVIVFYFALYS